MGSSTLSAPRTVARVYSSSVTHRTLTEGGGLPPITKRGAELAAGQEGEAEPETGMAEAGFSSGEIAGAPSRGRELAAAAADVGAERRAQGRPRRETVGEEMKRKTEFAALSTVS